MRDLAFGLIAAHLLVQRVEQLLAGGGSGKGGAVEERAAEAAEVEQPFRRAAEGNAHAIEQVDDAGAHLAHALDRGLVGEEVAAVDRVIEVGPGGVALALKVLGRVDAALGAHRVRALDGHQRKQINLAARFRNFDCSGEARKSTADDDDSWSRCCHKFSFGLAYLAWLLGMLDGITRLCSAGALSLCCSHAGSRCWVGYLATKA